MADLGSDFACFDDLTPELALVSGEDCLIQDLVWRLRTDRGGLFYDEAYGTNLMQFIHSPGANADTIASAAVAECEKDDRVEAGSMEADAQVSPDGSTVTLSLTGKSAAGPFEFVVLASALDVKLLTGAEAA